MSDVIEYYNNYEEETRLTTVNAKRIEFLTTVRAFGELFPSTGRILDCAAGAGIYSLYYADKGYEVTATDITPRHIDMINKELRNRNIKMNTAVVDATDLGCFENDSFDTVLCMGPIYHLAEKSDREKCLKECTRVLKKGGLLAVAYISRFFIFSHAALSNTKYLNKDFASTLIDAGKVNSSEPQSFWTHTYYHTPDEVENEVRSVDLTIIDHFAADGLSPSVGFKDKVNELNSEEFDVWCDYHYSVCREKSLLGSTIHGVVVGMKE